MAENAAPAHALRYRSMNETRLDRRSLLSATAFASLAWSAAQDDKPARTKNTAFAANCESDAAKALAVADAW